MAHNHYLENLDIQIFYSMRSSNFSTKTELFRNSLRAILTFKFDEYLVNTSGMLSVRGSVEYYPQCDCRGRLLILRYILRAAMFTTLETLPE